MEIDPINMKVLCSYCHLHWWHKDVLHATEWFKDKFFLRYDVLMRMAKLKFKIPTVDLAELHDTTKADGSDYGQAYYKLIQGIINESH
jgi:hypothetical protein